MWLSPDGFPVETDAPRHTRLAWIGVAVALGLALVVWVLA